ncbi:hypothetical protein JCM8547_008480 [Rhodosporidiobolus lusitaniae]
MAKCQAVRGQAAHSVEAGVENGAGGFVRSLFVCQVTPAIWNSMKSVVRQLVKVERIGLYDCPSIDEDYLAAMNGLQDVKRLSFDDTDISLPPSALDSSTFSRLTFLSLDCVTLTIETAAALLQVCTLPNLKALALAELREPAEEAEADDVVMFLPHLPDDFLAQLDVLQLALCDADFIPRDWIFSSTPVLVTVQSWDAHSEDQEARLIDSLLSAMPQHLSLQGVWSPFDCLSSWDGEQVERANDLFAQLVAYIENGPAVETLCSHPLSNRPLPSLTISPTAVATFFEPVRRHEAWEWGKALKEKEANKS